MVLSKTTLTIISTGTTGYIGGDALFAIVEAHPDWEITCLTRNSDKGAKIAAKYPSIRLVYGDLDSFDLIEEEAKQADIVYHFANCDHEGSAKAISRGLAKAGKPVHWIHTSGTMILAVESIDKKCWGDELPKVYNDLDGVHELVNMPDHAAHRPVDKIVLATSALNPNVKTAIVCPCTIYGPGRGPDNVRSHQAYYATLDILKRKGGFLPGKGKNVWNMVHIRDLSDLYLKIGESAISDGAATWNEQGYYLAENGSFAWGDVLREITKLCKKQGFIDSDETPELNEAQLKEIEPIGELIWGTNSRGEALRGKKLLGWQPTGQSLFDELPAIVESEATSLGLIHNHAAQVEKD
jgi:nucleoside-diphosphate-sugar epimerase